MDESRWPEPIRKFIDGIGAEAETLVIAVEYREPVWIIKASCPCCRLARLWNIMCEPPKPLPEETPIPDWVKSL